MRLKILIIFASFLIGCEDWESSGPKRLREVYEASCGLTDASQASSDVPFAVEPSDDIAGTFAGRFVQLGRMQIPGVCDDCLLTLTDLVLVQVQPALNLAFFEFCDQPMEIDTTPEDPTDPPDPMAPSTTIPEALRKASVSSVGTFEKAPGKKTLPAMKVLWLWGVLGLKDPEHDDLPDKQDSPFVWDQDHDGNPGVTIHVNRPIEGNRYMVRRALWNLQEGSLDSSGLYITGTLTFKVEEKALGADNQLLTMLAPITPQETGNFYQLRRVPKSFTCEDLRTSWQALFNEAPFPPPVNK